VTAVSAQVTGCVPVVYVTDIDLSVGFYTLLGFDVQVNGTADEWRYAYLTCEAASILLAAGGSVWSAEQGPVLLYLRLADVEVAGRALEEAGHTAEHLGYPDHAPGGEIKVFDPDGHGLLLGQVTGAPPADREVIDGANERANVLVRAAEAARRRGVTPHRCQFPLAVDRPCPESADVKLADSWGDSTWACLPHAEEIMLNARGAFIASEDSEGLAVYLRRRQGLT
jgi:hypothetical protein